MRLGRIGAAIESIAFQPARDVRDAVPEVEQLGYETLWIGETNTTREPLVHASLLLGWTERMTVATSIASIWARDPSAAANGARTLGEAFPGRFVLALGVSHRQLVDRRGHDYGRPLTAMRAYLEAMDAAEYAAPLPAEPVPRLLAALAPRMLRLAAEKADGTHPTLVTPEHTAWTRELIGDAPTIALKLQVILEPDPDAARQIARARLSPYLSLENYCNAWRRLGFEDTDFAAGGSDRLVDSLIAWGDEEAIRARVDAHFAAGADHVAINPAGNPAGPDALEQLRRLAPVLVEPASR